jgi:hypothetical protein
MLELYANHQFYSAAAFRGRRGERGTFGLRPNNDSERSSHSGFSFRTNSFFFSRRQDLISFSRVIAETGSENCS